MIFETTEDGAIISDIKNDLANHRASFKHLFET